MVATPIARQPASEGARLPGGFVGPLLVLIASVLLAGGIALIGFWTFAVLLYAAAAICAIRYPGYFASVLLGLTIAFEPAAIDFTRAVSLALYEGPPGTGQALPLTISPVEIATLVAAASLVIQRPAGSHVGLPLLVWMFPFCMLLGYLNGARLGAPYNLAYHEARGLIFGIIAFVAVLRLNERERRYVLPATLIGAGVLSLIVIARYVFIVRAGSSPVAVEFAYAHEDVLFLGTGIIIAGVTLLRPGSLEMKVATVLYMVVLAAAILATGRRVGTLVLGVGVLVTLWYLLPRRPVLIICVLVPLMVGGTAYLGAYWNKEYGALAQPARAIRSEISPSARDQSSNEYREIERANVIDTIRLDPLKGVGLGMPFAQFRPLPDLTGWWSLQHYTPHQGILWLWLKFGLPGISVALAIIVLAVSRCVAAIRTNKGLPLLPVVFIASIAMFATYSTVDLGFTGARTMVPFGGLLAAAFMLKHARRSSRLRWHLLHKRGGANVTAIDVVVTTFNRPEPLARCLRALAHQTYRDFRVIVVDDGGNPPAQTLLPADLHTQLDLTVIRNADNQGPAAGRNIGVGAGSAAYICFVDDDLVVDSEFLAAHVARAAREPERTVLFGPLIEPPDWTPTPWNRWEAATLARQYALMAAQAYQPTWRQFFTGNAFLRREDFERAGGFEPSLHRAEDIELAIRLEREGCRFVFNMEARALHYAERSLANWKRIPGDYARVDALIDRKYPEMRYADVVWRELRYRHTLHRLALRFVRRLHVGPATTTAALAAARLADAAGLHRLSHALVSFAWSALYVPAFEAALAAHTHLATSREDSPPASAVRADL